MRKILTIILILSIALGLTGCAFMELLQDGDSVVNLGDGENAVRWTLVSNDNLCSPVESAYFEFDQDSFKYYENGSLKKEGSHRITFYGVEGSNVPLHLNLNFGRDESGFSVYDYIDCYTEDAKEDLHQFTIVSEGYHIEPKRSGGVPVRDYHLSDMPYALGTYVKDGAQQYEYKNGRVNYLDSSYLNGTFVDKDGNSLYFVNNSFSASYQSSDYSKYTVYMRYENKANGSFIEGTIKPSWYEDWDTSKPHSVALIHVLYGENEPGEEAGTYAMPDYQLIDFTLEENSITFTHGEYFYENQECDFDPDNFVGGTYYKVKSE
ncbi:MAG: hypothetical protein J6B34_02850 [Clostridia bacterium]|nr:hypothetical protein [Clostridia bacterium]